MGNQEQVETDNQKHSHSLAARRFRVQSHINTQLSHSKTHKKNTHKESSSHTVHKIKTKTPVLSKENIVPYAHETLHQAERTRPKLSAYQQHAHYPPTPPLSHHAHQQPSDAMRYKEQDVVVRKDQKTGSKTKTTTTTKTKSELEAESESKMKAEASAHLSAYKELSEKYNLNYPNNNHYGEDLLNNNNRNKQKNGGTMAAPPVPHRHHHPKQDANKYHYESFGFNGYPYPVLLDLTDNQEDKEKAKEKESGTITALNKNKFKTEGDDKADKFPEQEWTYKDMEEPPEWLVPAKGSAPGAPRTKPPPVPEMIPPPPPIPFPNVNMEGFGGYGSPNPAVGTPYHPYGPPPPTYALPTPPPYAMNSWIPLGAFMEPGKVEE